MGGMEGNGGAGAFASGGELGLKKTGCMGRTPKWVGVGLLCSFPCSYMHGQDEGHLIQKTLTIVMETNQQMLGPLAHEGTYGDDHSAKSGS